MTYKDLNSLLQVIYVHAGIGWLIGCWLFFFGGVSFLCIHVCVHVIKSYEDFTLLPVSKIVGFWFFLLVCFVRGKALVNALLLNGFLIPPRCCVFKIKFFYIKPRTPDS